MENLQISLRKTFFVGELRVRAFSVLSSIPTAIMADTVFPKVVYLIPPKSGYDDRATTSLIVVPAPLQFSAYTGHSKGL